MYLSVMDRKAMLYCLYSLLLIVLWESLWDRVTLATDLLSHFIFHGRKWTLCLLQLFNRNIHFDLIHIPIQKASLQIACFHKAIRIKTP